MLGVLVSYIGSQTSAHAREKTPGTQGTGQFDHYYYYYFLAFFLFIVNCSLSRYKIILYLFSEQCNVCWYRQSIFWDHLISKVQLWRCKVMFWCRFTRNDMLWSRSHFNCVLVTFRVQSRCKHFMIDQTRSGKFVIVGMPRVYKSLKEMVDVHKKVWLYLHSVCITERKTILVRNATIICRKFVKILTKRKR